MDQFALLYSSLQQVVLHSLREKRSSSSGKSLEQSKVSESTVKLRAIQKQKSKDTPILLIIAIYLAPVILAFQLIGLCSLMIFGKYTPGFIFLITALLCLGYISMKIMIHDCTSVRKRSKKEKRKIE